MDENGKVASANCPIFPAHWDNTPITASSQAPQPISAGDKAVKLGNPPPGYKPG